MVDVELIIGLIIIILACIAAIWFTEKSSSGDLPQVTETISSLHRKKLPSNMREKHLLPGMSYYLDLDDGEDAHKINHWYVRKFETDSPEDEFWYRDNGTERRSLPYKGNEYDVTIRGHEYYIHPVKAGAPNKFQERIDKLSYQLDIERMKVRAMENTKRTDALPETARKIKETEAKHAPKHAGSNRGLGRGDESDKNNDQQNDSGDNK